MRENTMLGHVLIRADAGARLGIGHVMRCLAFAQAWQDAGGQVEFLSASVSPLLRLRLASERMEVTDALAPPGSDSDAGATIARATSIGAKWIVVDGYQFGSEFQQSLKDAGFKLLFIDDYGHCDHYCADLVLNQNLYAHERLYTQRHKRTTLLLGARYALLRREFLCWDGFQRRTPSVARKLLVTLGGADPDNVIVKVLQALAALRHDDVDVRAVLGPANQHAKQQLESSRFENVELLADVTKMPDQMAWADMAISGAGSTCWELLYMQVPSLLIVLADNQRGVAAELQERGLSWDLGCANNLSSERIATAVRQLLASTRNRERMSELGRNLVDGKGAFRIIQAVNELTDCVAGLSGIIETTRS
jgi:UDP-2,4-diacetamido-2,4,6-trideoxy-beta-L-altropyranose hydrolase